MNQTHRPVSVVLLDGRRHRADIIIRSRNTFDVGREALSETPNVPSPTAAQILPTSDVPALQSSS
ncbi:MAG: hypothetical protein GX875_06470 [Propionibacterium sp.]|nr:hypothetical protein [Propionibacterium sp.]